MRTKANSRLTKCTLEMSGSANMNTNTRKSQPRITNKLVSDPLILGVRIVGIWYHANLFGSIEGARFFVPTPCDIGGFL